MKVIIQRVSVAQVVVNKIIIAEINKGLLVLLGIAPTDSEKEAIALSKKITQLRIFEDIEGKMNHSVKEIEGEILLVSQFTLFANTHKGNRPSFTNAAKPEIAVPLYEKMISQLAIDMNKPIKTGQFGADMQVTLVNDGPVTIIIDTDEL